MSATTTAAPAQQYTPAMNMQDRMTLLSTGVPCVAYLGSFGAYSLGNLAIIKLRNVGVITKLRIRVTASVTIATAAAVASPYGPYGLIQRLDVLDYNTTQRTFASGPMLYFIDSIRHGRPWMPTGQGLVDTAQTEQPTATGASQAFEFTLDCPLAVDPQNDLTGAILAQTVVGEQYLRILFNAAAQTDPFTPYAAASGGSTVAFSNINVQVWQYYIQPQSASIPRIDLNTVYELAGIYTTYAGITAGANVYLDYPNVRTVMGFYMAYINNATVTVNGTDISGLTLVANGNTNMREQDPLLVRADMRQHLGGDLGSGIYYISSRRNPIQTYIYSQVQEKVAIAAASGTPYIAYAFESTYPLNTPLPGIAASN